MYSFVLFQVANHEVNVRSPKQPLAIQCFFGPMLDEIPHFSRSNLRFLMGYFRSWSPHSFNGIFQRQSRTGRWIPGDLEEGSLVGGIPTYPSEKYEEFVNWDHEIPNWMESHSPFMFQTTKQVYYIYMIFPYEYSHSKFVNRSTIKAMFQSPPTRS